MRAHECAFLGSKVFPDLAGSGLCNSEPTSGRDTSKATPLKTSLPIEAQGQCPPTSIRAAFSNGSHLLTHRCIAVAARRLAGPIACLLAAHVKPPISL